MKAPRHCSAVLCLPSSRAMEDYCLAPVGFSKSDPLEVGPITEVGMTYGHPSMEGNPHCCQQDTSRLRLVMDPAICLVFFAQPEQILCLPHFPVWMLS